MFVTGRLNDFELVGEKGTKCPNLSIGQADLKANVFVRFAFQYDRCGAGASGICLTAPCSRRLWHSSGQRRPCLRGTCRLGDRMRS